MRGGGDVVRVLLLVDAGEGVLVEVGVLAAVLSGNSVMSRKKSYTPEAFKLTHNPIIKILNTIRHDPCDNTGLRPWILGLS